MVIKAIAELAKPCCLPSAKTGVPGKRSKLVVASRSWVMAAPKLGQYGVGSVHLERLDQWAGV